MGMVMEYKSRRSCGFVKNSCSVPDLPPAHTNMRRHNPPGYTGAPAATKRRTAVQHFDLIIFQPVMLTIPLNSES